MTFLRPLHVVASFAVVAVAGMACTVEDDGGGLSVSQSGSPGESSGGSSGSSSSGGTTAAVITTGEGTSSGSSSTTVNPTTTADPTTGSVTTGEATTGVEMTTGAAGGCGDGVISGNEQCDGDNLNNFNCEALGNAGGTLLCDPMTCTFDTQMCEVGGGDSGGGTSG